MAVATPTRPGPLVIPSSSSPGINSAPAVPTLHNADRPQWPRSNSFHDASPFALDSRDLRHLFGHDDSASDASSPFASSASSQASLSVPASPTVGDPTKASTGDQMALPPDFAGLSVFGEAGPLAHHMTPRRYDSHGSTSSDTGAYTSWPPSHASSYASSSTLPHSPHAQSVATTAVPIRQTSWSQQQQEYDLNGGMAPQGIDLDPTPVAHHGWSAQQYPPGWYGAPASLVDPSVFGGEGGLPIPPLQMPPPQTGPSYSLRAGRARPGQYVDFVGGVNGDAASSDGEDEIQVDQDAGWAYRARTDASDDEYVPPPEDHDPNEGAWQHAEHPDTLDHSAYMPYLPPTYSPQQGEPSAPPTPTRRGRRTPIAAPGDPVHWQSQTSAYACCESCADAMQRRPPSRPPSLVASPASTPNSSARTAPSHSRGALCLSRAQSDTLQAVQLARCVRLVANRHLTSRSHVALGSMCCAHRT